MEDGVGDGGDTEMRISLQRIENIRQECLKSSCTILSLIRTYSSTAPPGTPYARMRMAAGRAEIGG